MSNELKVDAKDKQILAALSENARQSWQELSKRIELSAPAIGDRVRRLQDLGIIQAYRLDVDLSLIGYPLTAIVTIKPNAGAIESIERLLMDMSACLQCDKVTGDACIVARLVFTDMAMLDRIIDRIGQYGVTHTAMIKSSPIHRTLPLG